MTERHKPGDDAEPVTTQAGAKAEHDDFMKEVGLVLDAAVALKKIMVRRNLTRAKAQCPKCYVRAALQGHLVIGQAAGRHRSSGGAFRMWCETPDCGVRMME